MSHTDYSAYIEDKMTRWGVAPEDARRGLLNVTLQAYEGMPPIPMPDPVALDGVVWTAQSAYCPVCGHQNLWADETQPPHNRAYLCTWCISEIAVLVMVPDKGQERTRTRARIQALKTQTEANDREHALAETMHELQRQAQEE